MNDQLLGDNFIIVWRPDGSVLVGGKIAHRVYFEASYDLEGLRTNPNYKTGSISIFHPSVRSGERFSLGPPIDTDTVEDGDVAIIFRNAADALCLDAFPTLRFDPSMPENLIRLEDQHHRDVKTINIKEQE